MQWGNCTELSSYKKIIIKSWAYEVLWATTTNRYGKLMEEMVSLLFRDNKTFCCKNDSLRVLAPFLWNFPQKFNNGEKLIHKSENRQKCVDVLLIASLDEFLKQTEYIITHVSMYTFFKCPQTCLMLYHSLFIRTLKLQR